MFPTVPQAVQPFQELLLWLIPQLDKFPRVRRFTLGGRGCSVRYPQIGLVNWSVVPSG
jgi:hypothetical protein